MATKWKNKLKFFLLLLCVTYGLHSLFWLVSEGRSYIGKDYFSTGEFSIKIEQYLDDLALFELNKTTEEEAKKKISVTQNEIEEHRYRYGNLSEQIASIYSQYDPLIEEAQSNGQLSLADTYKKERDTKIADISQNFASDDYVKDKIIKEKEALIAQFFADKERQYKEFLKNKNAFSFYFANEKTKDVYTNIPDANQRNLEEMEKNKNIAYVMEIYDLDLASRSYDSLLTNIETTVYTPAGEIVISANQIPKEVFPEGIYQGWIAVSKETIQSHPFWQNYHSFLKQKETFYFVVISGAILLIASIPFFRKMTVDEILPIGKWENYYAKIPLDVRIAAFIFTIFLAWLTLSVSYYVYHYESLATALDDAVIFLGSSALLLLFAYVQGSLLLPLIKDAEQRKNAWKKSAAMQMFDILQGVFIKAPIGIQAILLLIIAFLSGAGLIVSFVFIWDYYNGAVFIFYCLAMLFIGLPVIVFFLQRVRQLNQLAVYLEKLANGDFQANLPLKGKSIFVQMANNINILKEGLASSQKVQAKSERLKTELITNVSHDLRTPLTAIITYTELIKKPSLSKEEKNSYIQIIDRKAKRLKALIDDLFEVSKMESGNVELVKEKIDLTALLEQALAEHDEEIKKSSLEFRTNYPAPPLYAYVDGQKLWRVFDNLISNILKYSLEQTRVYITMTAIENYVIITFKNITKYELGENVDELIERFKRGDASRNTEGSGLGLAIAKSIIDLHGGQLDIEVDGDLFKVTIQLPIQ